MKVTLPSPVSPNMEKHLPDYIPSIFISDLIDDHKCLTIPGIRWVELAILEEYIELRFGRVLVRPYSMISWRGGTTYALSRNEFSTFLKGPIRSHHDEISNAQCSTCGGPGLMIFNYIDCFRGC